MLAPEIVEAILDGRQPAGLQLDDLLNAFPLEWAAQRNAMAVLSDPQQLKHFGPDEGTRMKRQRGSFQAARPTISG
jgi:hypothetical protein